MRFIAGSRPTSRPASGPMSDVLVADTQVQAPADEWAANGLS
jgi:hypothetical protein